MPSEAPFSITGKGPNNELVTLRGDNFQELIANANAVLGEGVGSVYVSDVYAAALRSAGSQATATVAAAVGPVAVVSQPASVIGNGAVAQPGHAPVPQPQAAGALPPTVVYPGDCPHGVRPYKESMAKGQMWRRFDCASPWVKGNDAHNATRCRSVNV